jgi:hypothetical protein
VEENLGSDQPPRPKIEIVAHGGVQPVRYDDGAFERRQRLTHDEVHAP